jgi:hypothetical protein
MSLLVPLTEGTPAESESGQDDGRHLMMSKLPAATQGHRLVNESDLALASFLLSTPVHSARAPSRWKAPYKCDSLVAE